ncbi:HutD/Ves family protein [Modestobacter sp. SYSU DS0657]
MDPGSGSLIRCARTAAIPWRNGGGRTRELHAGDGWRLSVATISAVGPFSAFPGRDRTLVVADGRLRLAVGDREQRSLARGHRVDFAGEAGVRAEPVGGPVLAVNVMTERARCTASVRVVRVDGAAPAADALVLLAGRASGCGEQLAPCDAVLGAESGAVRGAGALLVAVSVEAVSVEDGSVEDGSMEGAGS